MAILVLSDKHNLGKIPNLPGWMKTASSLSFLLGAASSEQLAALLLAPHALDYLMRKMRDCSQVDEVGMGGWVSQCIAW